MNEVVEYQTRTAPADLLHLAITQGTGIDQLEKLLNLQERYEATEARKAYVSAMAAFKMHPPKITKDRHVAFGNTAYDHASLANVTEAINSALSEHGLSASWKTDQSGELITVTCCITHVLGHQECTSLSAAPDKSGNKNSIQAIGSAISYLQRYSLLALTGLATHDQDTDGVSPAEDTYITQDQITQLSKLLIDKGYDPKEKMQALSEKVYNIPDILELPASKFSDAIKRVNKLASREPGVD